MPILATIEGEAITLHEDGHLSFKAKAAVDTDGSGPLHGDPCAQKDTSLHVNDKALNADIDIYIVVPPSILNGVAPVVLGCKAHVRNTLNGKETDAVVGDIGPRKKLGEISVACASALGINPSPNSGGEDSHVIEYQIWPGISANVNGKVYPLQHS